MNQEIERLAKELSYIYHNEGPYASMDNVAKHVLRLQVETRLKEISEYLQPLEHNFKNDEWEDGFTHYQKRINKKVIKRIAELERQLKELTDA